jgi:hypothetical protein
VRKSEPLMEELAKIIIWWKCPSREKIEKIK